MTRHLSLIILLSVAVAGFCSAQDISVQESRKSKIEKEIRILEQQLKDNSSKSGNALANIKILNQKEAARKALLKESEKEISALDDSLSACTSEIARLQSRLDTMSFYYNKLVKNAYKNRDARVWYMYILTSEDLGQALRRFSYLKSLSRNMNEQGIKIKEARSELGVRLDNLTKMRARAERLRNSHKLELDKLRQEEKETKQLVSRLNSQKSKYQKELKAKKKQVEDLNKEIQRLIAEAVKKSGKTKTAESVSVLAREFQNNKGNLPWPADGPVADHFGRHNHPVYKSLVMPFNNGINVSVNKGTGVKAVFDGDVQQVIVMPGYGKCVLIRHGEYFTFYCKLSKVSVRNGEKIKTGQTVGIVDTIDGLTQYHFQLWKGTEPQNPELWLKPKD